MSKFKKQYICTNCGIVSFKWLGCCESCGGWNTFEEKILLKTNSSNLNKGLELQKNEILNQAIKLENVNLNEQSRFTISNQPALNKLFGGGIVKGSLCLIGGCPGIGKSTLLLQMCAILCKKNKVLYVSGEESKTQIKMRANRLKISNSNLFVLSEFDIELILNEITKLKPEIVVVDSIQTVSFSQIPSSCGSVAQVKQCTYFLQKMAKEKNITTILVGHVNKEGNIAGPKVLEHVVDVVLSFEGEQKFSYRILKAVKNRFGPTNEIAVFEMKEKGLFEVEDWSKELLSERPKNVSGNCVCCFMEGSSLIFAEIQSIVAYSNFAIPKRMSKGFDYGKLALMIAVLETRVGLSFKNLDCYVNVVGGLKLDNVFGCDLALALALISSLKKIPIDDDIVAFGEIGLSGEVRSASGFEKAIVEAKKLGFKKIFLPKSCVNKLQHSNYGVKIVSVSNVSEAMLKIF